MGSITVKHLFVDPGTDWPDDDPIPGYSEITGKEIVRPSNWNADHDITLELDSSDVGLGNVDNTSDLDKPMSTAVQNALADTTSGTEGAKLIGFQQDDTVYEMLTDMLNRGILHGFSITNTSGLNITWTSGDVWNPVTDLIAEVDAQVVPQACTDNAINYLKWISGSSLTLGTTEATGDEILIARIDTFDGLIHTIRVNEFLSTVVSSTRRSLRAMFPLVATSGLIISEKSGVGTWDVVLSEGVYIEDGHVYVSVGAIDSTVTNLIRVFHTTGVWDHEHNAQIDVAFWDNGTGKTAVTANKYYKSLFMVGDDIIYWIYPQAEYATKAQAIAAPLPIPPTGLSKHLQVTAVVLRGDASAFPAAGDEAWIDVRPRLTGSAFGPVTDHGALSGLEDDDHTQYVLKSGSLTQLTTRNHSDLGSIGANDHHNQLHAAAHLTGGGDTISSATTDAAGLMAAADKTKLDGIATGAEVNVNADWNSGSGDSQILNKPSSMTPASHGNEAHSSTFITSSGVTYDNLNANGDVGTGSDQVAVGNHTHDNILSDAMAFTWFMV